MKQLIACAIFALFCSATQASQESKVTQQNLSEEHTKELISRGTFIARNPTVDTQPHCIVLKRFKNGSLVFLLLEHGQEHEFLAWLSHQARDLYHGTEQQKKALQEAINNKKDALINRLKDGTASTSKIITLKPALLFDHKYMPMVMIHEDDIKDLNVPYASQGKATLETLGALLYKLEPKLKNFIVNFQAEARVAEEHGRKKKQEYQEIIEDLAENFCCYPPEAAQLLAEYL